MGFRGGMGGPSGGGWRQLMDADDTQQASLTWPLLRRVLGYARPYWMNLVLTLVLILVSTGLGLVTPLLMMDLIDNILPSQDTTRLNWLAVALIVIPVVNGLLRVWQRKVNADVGEGLIYDLRVSLYAHLQRLPLSFFTHTRTGELMSRVNNDVVGAQTAISSTIVEIITNLVTVVATLVVLFTLEWRLTLLGLLVLPLFIFAARRMTPRLRLISHEQMDQTARMNAMMNETLNISGALLVKLFGRRTNEIERFQNRAAMVRDKGIERAVAGSQFFMLISLVGSIGTALIYWLGGHLVVQGVFTVGTIIAFGTYLIQLYGPLQNLTNAPVSFAQSMVSFERVFEVIDLPLEIEEKPGALSLKQVAGAIVFDGVSFDYNTVPRAQLSEVTRHGRIENIDTVLSGEAVPREPESDTVEREVRPYSQARDKALEDVTFCIEPGQMVALVGPSGAGKTTLTYLIPRLYDPVAGSIRLDGHDLRDVTLDSLPSAMGMVTQETYLFHDTIRTNLLYARLDATDAELIAACKAANIHDFIMGLSDGYDTVVGERGYRLSGGEKQRIAIARVILKDPRILILDEATSHLDSQSEALIQEALRTVRQGRTSLIIAHRLSTILAADQILVMDRGRIVEQGTHAQLLAQGGLYTRLYETQFSQDHEAVLHS